VNLSRSSTFCWKMVFRASEAFVTLRKIPETLSKPISLNIGEREEEKERNQVLYASVRLP